MLKNVIQGHSVNEVYQAGEALTRGMVVVKNFTTNKADKADNVSENIYFADKNFQPTGYQSDMEISEYTTEAQAIGADERFILKRLMSGTWATDLIDTTGLVGGDYLKAGTAANEGKLIKAVLGDVCTLRYVGTYDDAGNALHSFEVVPAHTVA